MRELFSIWAPEVAHRPYSGLLGKKEFGLLRFTRFDQAFCCDRASGTLAVLCHSLQNVARLVVYCRNNRSLLCRDLVQQQQEGALMGLMLSSTPPISPASEIPRAMKVPRFLGATSAVPATAECGRGVNSAWRFTLLWEVAPETANFVCSFYDKITQTGV